MPSLTNILGRIPTLSPSDREWLHLLVADWQPIADLEFADLVLMVEQPSGRFVIVASARPATASTSFDNDVVGMNLAPKIVAPFHLPDLAPAGESIELNGLVYEGHPVVHEGRPIAVLAVVRNERTKFHSDGHHPSYIRVPQQMLDMVARGEFPIEDTPSGLRHGTPRVTDGFTHLDTDGAIVFSSPNAISNFNRLGVKAGIEGTLLSEQVTEALPEHASIDENLPLVLAARAPMLTELEVRGATVSLRSIPLTVEGEPAGGVLLSRDVTEVRRREQELVTKDATIREINHRVKNNLQTVSALLNMQSRRATDPATMDALHQAQSRVAAIGLVHQILSQSVEDRVNFDDIFNPLLNMASDIASVGVPVVSHVEGSFGVINADVATPLAIVFNELVSNAVEHGLPEGGTILVEPRRDGNHLIVDVTDNGVGLGGKTSRGLGTKIVRTMVEGELSGSISWDDAEGGGTRVHVDVDLAKASRRD
ncbi:sensor histidine kinase [Neoactinobaculum massilliense]|uniref:sensor histidine kinase n=1 Tax=Neoactinobaculum massilliense TaxID=2364794 RepID=UPI000F546EF5|nr:sensor histidine kinase [Neoactinobaculum massilliense]